MFAARRNQPMKIFGGNQGQFGDLAMMTVVARAIKDEYPKSHYTLGIGNRYAEIAPLFKNHSYIDDVRVLQSYGKLTQEDEDWISSQNFDLILNMEPQHRRYDWWNFYHQAAEACVMNGFVPPIDLTVNWSNEMVWKKVKRKNPVIAFAPFGNFGKCRKSLKVETAQEIVNKLQQNSVDVIQIGHHSEHLLQNCEIKNGISYEKSVECILSTDLFLTVDTGLAWVTSGYEIPTIGIYFKNGVVPKLDTIQPYNESASYLNFENNGMVDIQQIFQTIFEKLQKSA